jgi:HD-GYP domain-containing protein (c-di-GMP phosphodiesterase class II)
LGAPLAEPDLDAAVFALEPGRFAVPLDEDYLDEIAAAFGQVVDSKSPYTAGHSTRVALYTEGSPRRWRSIPAAAALAQARGLAPRHGQAGREQRDPRQAGEAGRGGMGCGERHALYTESILSRIDAFEELARVSGAHHERLDGKGYPRGIRGDAISLETRIITTADIFDAITAERPYRGAMPVSKTLEIMGEEVGRAIDARCFDALKQIVGGLDLAEVENA